RDPASDPADFHAALDSLKRTEGALDLAVLESAMFGGGDDGQGISDIQFADEVEMELGRRQLEFAGRGAKLQIEGANSVSLIQSKTFHGTMRHLQQGREVGVVAVAEELSVARNQVDEPAKGGLDL